MTSPESGVPELPNSGLGPLGDIQLLAAMLRNDRNDIASYVSVLSGTLGSALPPGMVEIEYQRSMGDRLAGRPGHPIRLSIHGADGDFDLADAGHGRVAGQLRRTVNGVVISRKEIGIDEWVQALATELAARAAQDAAARDALGRLLGG